MKTIYFLSFICLVLISCSESLMIEPKEEVIDTSKEIWITSGLKKGNSSARPSLPSNSYPYIPQDLYVGEDYSTIAINSVTGSGYYYNVDQPNNLAMASTGGNIYSIIASTISSTSTLYRLNPAGGYTDLGYWTDAHVMTANGSYLYIVSGATLYKVNASTGSRTPFSAYPNGWEGTVAMASTGNYLYAVQGATMYRVDLSNGSVGTFSAYPDGWAGTTTMAATGGYIYAVQGATMYKVSSGGAVTTFSAYPNGWAGTKAMTAKNGYVYAAQDNSLWKVSTSNGSVNQIGSLTSWTGVTAMTELQ